MRKLEFFQQFCCSFSGGKYDPEIQCSPSYLKFSPGVYCHILITISKFFLSVFSSQSFEQILS